MCLNSHAVTFQFDGTSVISGGSTVKSKMEAGITALLTEIDRAGKAGGALNLSAINMEPNAKSRLNDYWTEASRFVCIKPSYVARCLDDAQGFQVRGIPIKMQPVDDSYNESLSRELVISLNRDGVITGVRPSMQLEGTIMSNEGGGVTDMRMRREILKWVEDFRCYYNERNLGALRQIYSEDALIITGSVVTKVVKNKGDFYGVRTEQRVKYSVQDKQQYINKLARMFADGKKINVQFDHISVVSHPAKENIYGVTLHQVWQHGAYKDDGWLFLLWDFQNEDHPQIHVRTWQPEQAINEHGQFTIDDVFIP